MLKSKLGAPGGALKKKPLASGPSNDLITITVHLNDKKESLQISPSTTTFDDLKTKLTKAFGFDGENQPKIESIDAIYIIQKKKNPKKSSPDADKALNEDDTAESEDAGDAEKDILPSGSLREVKAGDVLRVEITEREREEPEKGDPEDPSKGDEDLEDTTKAASTDASNSLKKPTLVKKKVNVKSF